MHARGEEGIRHGVRGGMMALHRMDHSFGKIPELHEHLPYLGVRDPEKGLFQDVIGDAALFPLEDGEHLRVLVGKVLREEDLPDVMEEPRQEEFAFYLDLEEPRDHASRHAHRTAVPPDPVRGAESPVVEELDHGHAQHEVADLLEPQQGNGMGDPVYLF